MREAVLRRFEYLGFPKEFSKDRLTRLLQKTVNAVYLKGFRYLGDKNDFDHGHIIYIGSVIKHKPVAILYHTQERAHVFHRDEPGSQYDYLDTAARNWIQWLPSGKVENANKYVRRAYPRTKKWRRYVKYALPKFKQAYTIGSEMISPKYLGGQRAGSIQWSFYDVKEKDYRPTPDNNVIKVTVPCLGEIFLTLTCERNPGNEFDPSPPLTS